jgi:hypothetical protein
MRDLRRASWWIWPLCALAACSEDAQVITPDAGPPVDISPPNDVTLDRPRDAPSDARDGAVMNDVVTDISADRGAPDVTRDVPALRCAAGVDSDGDGLANDAECRAGSDPFSPDSDMDGLRDGAEAMYPRICVATDRARQRRPPVSCNTDAMCMAGEACRGLSPTSADSDGDGVLDGHEDPSGQGRIDVARGETDPRLWDTDGDGASDGMSGIAICRPDGLAQVVQTGLPMAPTQVGYDPAWGAGRRLTGTMTRGALVLDDTRASVSAVVAALPAVGDITAESTRVEMLVTRALGAGVTPVLVGQSFTTHEGNPGVTSTYRVARSTTASALRDATLTMLVGATMTSPAVVGMSTEFLADITTVRRTMGRSAGTTDVIVTVAPRALLEDRAWPAAIRARDINNSTAVAESDKGLGFHCQRFRAPALPQVDFVWPVDVSPSMGPYQESIGDTAQRFFTDLAAAAVDFRVAVLAAQPTPFNFATPGLRFVQGTNATGAQELAFRVTTEPYRMMTADRLAPYPNNGTFTLQANEEPIAAAVIAFDQLAEGARTGAPLDQRTRAGARLVAFLVADETGRNDDMRYFERTPARWGATYAARLQSVVRYFRERNILTFGMVNDQGTDCARAVDTDMRRCVILGNGGAYIPIRTATPAEVAAAMQRIVNTVVGSTSPYRLERQPVTSTLKVRVRNMDVPRSRSDGFDYEPVSNSVVFWGNRYRPNMGDEVVISFRLWQPCPGLGATCSTTSECCAPQVCNLGRCSAPCAALNAACMRDADCCAPNACVSGRCAPPATCRPSGETCRVDAECCAPARCLMGTCGTPPPCRPNGMSCTTNDDCCSQTCTSGRCEPPPCRPISGMCTSASDCCSQSCANGQCAPG